MLILFLQRFYRKTFILSEKSEGTAVWSGCITRNRKKGGYLLPRLRAIDHVLIMNRIIKTGIIALTPAAILYRGGAVGEAVSSVDAHSGRIVNTGI